MSKGCSEGDVDSASPLAIFSWSVLTSPGLVPPTLAHPGISCTNSSSATAQARPQHCRPGWGEGKKVPMWESWSW